MTVRIVFIFVLLLFLSDRVSAEGSYVRTKDRKTLVWTNYPRQGETVKWSGRRDKQGYAIGFGTLTWYKADSSSLKTGSFIPFGRHVATSRFSGNMVHGKLDGAVLNVDPTGERFHATFVDGRKTTDWTAGPLPSGSSAIARREESATPARTQERTAGANERREETIPRAELVEEPPPPAAGPGVIPEQRPMPSLPPRTVTEAPSPLPEKQPATQAVSKPVPKSTPSEYDDSLRSLVGPPSSLRMEPAAAQKPQTPKSPPAATAPPVASPATNGGSTSLSSPPPAKLTSAEVIGLADAEARTQGYDLGEYERPLTHYSAENGNWSVSYDPKSIDPNGMGASAKHLSVTVEDKTKKISLAPGK